MAFALVDKINVAAIVVQHLNTLVDDRTHRRSPWDFVLFFGVPILAAVLLWQYAPSITDATVGVLTNALALLAGLLFNLLVVLQSLRWPKAAAGPRRGAELRQQVYSNIAYSILVSLIALVPLAIAANWPDLASVQRRAMSTVAVGLVLHFGLTLCMVLKRMHVLLKLEFSRED